MVIMVLDEKLWILINVDLGDKSETSQKINICYHICEVGKEIITFSDNEIEKST